MSRITGPKCRMCRREKTKLFLKGDKCYTDKCAVARKPYAPGQNGLNAMRAKISEYGRQLSAARTVRRTYDLTEKTLRAFYKKSAHMQGNQADNLMRLIEMRLDNVVYRTGMVSSRSAARQAVGHGHFMLNGRRVDVPSIQVRVGDVIELTPRMKESSLYAESGSAEPTASWIEAKGAAVEVTEKPSSEDIESLGFNSQTIIEFYSR